MYALPNKTQHKLIAKVRGGISQKIENLNSSSYKNSNSSASPISSNIEHSNEPLLSFDDIRFSLPKAVFHTNTHPSNGKKSFNHRAHKQNITPSHHEMIKYVQQTWRGVEKNYEKSSSNSQKKQDTTTIGNNSAKITGRSNKRTTSLLLSGTYYHNTNAINTKNTLPSFTPFDLETFWGNRIMKRLTEE